MLPWKLRKRQILLVNQNFSSVYFSPAKFQLVSCNLSLAMIWQMTYAHKQPKLCSATLNAGEGIEASFQQHKAKWHDSCRLKFNKPKRQRAEKRKAAPDDSSRSKSPRKCTRRSLEKLPNPIHHCSFCGKLSKLKVKSPYIAHRHLSLMPEFVTALYSYRTNLY